MTSVLTPTAEHFVSDRPARQRLAHGLSVVRHQLKFDLLSMTRNRQARFFTMAMPVAFLLLFCAIFGNGYLNDAGQHIRSSTYYVASLTTFAIVDVAFMSLVIGLVEVRENGVLRRRQATPQPSWSIVVSRALTAIIMATAVVLASVVFCFLGFAVTGLVRSIQSAQPTAMALAMPLFFISGVFIPWPFIPKWLQHVADVFPLRDLTLAIQAPITSHGGSIPWSGGDLAVVALWGLGGLIIAMRTFKWAPQDQ
jgi:ABC-2 type transport system permease protein